MFLATRVLSDLDDSSSTNNSRVSAGEFGKWASKLVRYMGEGGRRASISDATFQIVQTVRQSPRADGSRLFHTPQHRSPRHSGLHGQSDDIEESPSRRILKPSGLPHDLVEELEAHAESHEAHLSHHNRSSDEVKGNNEGIEALDEAVQDLELDEQEHQDDFPAKSKRRKRGARRKHKTDGHSSAPDAKTSSSLTEDPAGLASSPDVSLSEASQHIQALAREISQATRPPFSTSMSATVASFPAYTSQTPLLSSIGQPRPSKFSFADRFKGAFANGNPDLQAFTERARQRELALTGPVTRNPTASAPAKMQQGSFAGVDSGVSSFGSVASTGSWSEEQANRHWASTGSRRDRVGGGGNKRQDHSSHSYSPAQSYSHERTSRPTRPPRSPLQQPTPSATVSASSSPSRQSFTPLSSFSSSTSYESRGASRPPRAGLHSIDETVNKQMVETSKNCPPSSTVASRPLVGDANLAPQQKDIFPTNTATITTTTTTSQFLTNNNNADAPTSVANPSILSNSTSTPSASRIIREPLAPPVEQPSPTSNAPRAKLGRLFNKFSRG